MSIKPMELIMSDTKPLSAPSGTILPNYGWGAPVIATIAVIELILFSILAVYLKNDNLLLLIGGAIVANSTTAVGFYLGSSNGSQNKDTTIAQQLARPSVNT